MANGDDISDGARAAALLAYAQQHYGTALGTGGDDDLTDAALRGIMTSVRDPYTVYSRRERTKDERVTLGWKLWRHRRLLGQLKDGRIVVAPIEHMPAAKAGMKPGEVVDTVDGKPVRSLRSMSLKR